MLADRLFSEGRSRRKLAASCMVRPPRPLSSSPLSGILRRALAASALVVASSGMAGCGWGGIAAMTLAIVSASTDDGSSPAPPLPGVVVTWVPDREYLREHGDPYRIPIRYRLSGGNGVRGEFAIEPGDGTPLSFHPATALQELPPDGNPDGERSMLWDSLTDVGEGPELVRVRLTAMGGGRKGLSDISDRILVGTRPPQAILQTPTSKVSGNVVLPFSLVSDAGDPVTIILELSVRDGPFSTITVLEPRECAAPSGECASLRASPDPGASHLLVWDSVADLGRTSHPVRIRMIPRDAFSTGEAASTDPFTVDNNSDPLAVIGAPSSGESYEICIPFSVIDEDSHVVDVIVQYAVAPEGFPPLPAEFLDPEERRRLLADEGTRRDLRIASPRTTHLRGRTMALDGPGAGTERIRVPELFRSGRLYPFAMPWPGDLPFQEDPPDPGGPGDPIGSTRSPHVATPIGEPIEILPTQGDVLTATITEIDPRDQTVRVEPPFPEPIPAGTPWRIPWKRDGIALPSAALPGVVHSFVWNSRSDIGNIAELSVRFRVTPFDSESGVATEASTTVDNRSFREPMSLRGTAEPRNVAFGDFDGNGRIDLVVADDRNDIVCLYLQDEYGVLPAEPSQIIGPDPGRMDPVAVAAGDLDGDGRDDIAVANEGADNVMIYLQLEEGGIGVNPEIIPTGDRPASLAIGDLDGVPPLDIAVACEGAELVYTHLGTGFPPVEGPILDAGKDPIFVMIADCVGDEGPDLLVSAEREDAVAIFERTGSGTEWLQKPPRSLRPLGRPNGLAMGDWGGDARLDLAVGVTGAGEVHIFFRTPEGDLPATADVVLPVGQEPRSLAAGDWNGDGICDLAVAAVLGDRVEIYVETEKGAFDPSPFQTIFARTPEHIGARDINQDGLVDLVVAERLRSEVQVYLQSGPGTLPPLPNLVIPGFETPAGAALGDLNGDGRADLAVLNAARNEIAVFYQEPGGGYPPVAGLRLAPRFSLSVAMGVPPRARIVDLNADGRLDLMVAASEGIEIWFQDAHGGLPPSGSSTLEVAGSTDLGVGDLNGDGREDLVLTSPIDTLRVYPQGDSGFGGDPQVLGAGFRSLDVGDLDGDGREDLVATTMSEATIFYQGPGGLEEGQTVPVGLAAKAIRIVDIDTVPPSEIVLLGAPATPGLLVLSWGEGQGYGASQSIPMGDNPSDLAVGDVGGDGSPEVIALDFGTDPLVFRRKSAELGGGDGQAIALEVCARLPVGPGRVAVEIADLNGDGRKDLVLVNQAGQAIEIFKTR